ncbi:BTAD domain-containing putative transcriptional regulator [Flindersiella endophytica]
MELRVLGPVELYSDGRSIGIAAAKQRALLALLVVERGRSVSGEWLIDHLWEGDPPSTARATVQSCVYRLRKLLDSVGAKIELVTRPEGYQLEIPAGLLDLDRFDRAMAEGQEAARAGDFASASAAYRGGLGLWRGEAFETVDAPAVRECSSLLRGRWLDAVEGCLGAELAMGEYVSVASELESLLIRYPMREALWQLRMLALARGGRKSDALELYRKLYRLLDDELGIEPSEPLRELHQQILNDDMPGEISAPPFVAAGVGTEAVSAVGCVKPRILPVAIGGFTGRDQDLARLEALLRSNIESLPAAESETARSPEVVISAISGMAGVGKTMLAVHWAHRVADRFPDGQLYVDLRGFHPSDRPMSPAEALRGFLDALGVPAGRIPKGFDAQAGLYRSLLAGRRMLVVLDNARDTDQVRSLLPGAPGCFVIVTSRSQLAGLVGAEAARPLLLDLLTFDEARELLAWRLGWQRTDAEPQAVDAIIAACARLPLALVMVAAQAATHPGFSLQALADGLSSSAGVLDGLASTDAGADVRTVFSWSYRLLSPQAAQVFRQLGLHNGPDISAPAVASLVGRPLTQVRGLLSELTRVHLVNEQRPGRYTCHDLLRAYAAELASAEPESDRDQARQRMYDHYLQTACAAAFLIAPRRDRIQVSPPMPGVVPESLDDYDQAMAWLDAERRVLLAAIEQAAATGFDAQVWRLAWALPDFLKRRGHRHDRVVVQRLALDAAERLGEPAVCADIHLDLAKAYNDVGRIEDGMTHLREALELYQKEHNVSGEAHTHYTVAFMMQAQGRYAESLTHAMSALTLFRRADDKRGQCSALNGAAWCHAKLGEHAQALLLCGEALALQEALDHVSGQAATLDTLAYVHECLGDHAEASRCYQQAIQRYRRLRDRGGEADTLTHLGDSQQAAGDHGAARESWRQALTIWRELEHPAADLVRTKMEELNRSSTR